MIPGLEKAEFVRFGVMHEILFRISKIAYRHCNLWKGKIFAAGQITGTEGYAAARVYTGINASLLAKGKKPVAFLVNQ